LIIQGFSAAHVIRDAASLARKEVTEVFKIRRKERCQISSFGD
jgi:hypothetical protein